MIMMRNVMRKMMRKVMMKGMRTLIVIVISACRHRNE